MTDIKPRPDFRAAGKRIAAASPGKRTRTIHHEMFLLVANAKPGTGDVNIEEALAQLGLDWDAWHTQWRICKDLARDMLKFGYWANGDLTRLAFASFHQMSVERARSFMQVAAEGKQKTRTMHMIMLLLALNGHTGTGKAMAHALGIKPSMGTQWSKMRNLAKDLTR